MLLSCPSRDEKNTKTRVSATQAGIVRLGVLRSSRQKSGLQVGRSCTRSSHSRAPINTRHLAGCEPPEICARPAGASRTGAVESLRRKSWSTSGAASQLRKGGGLMTSATAPDGALMSSKTGMPTPRSSILSLAALDALVRLRPERILLGNGGNMLQAS